MKSIKMYRVARNMRQRELAGQVGITVSYLSLIENGKRSVKYSVLDRIAKALKVPLFILVFLEFDRNSDMLDDRLREMLSSASLEPTRHGY